MYQRYYKQRKFGRVFSYVLVVGSGLSHYIRSALNFCRNKLTLETVFKYEEYIPDNTKHLLNNLKVKDRLDVVSSFSKTAKRREFENKFFLYKQNLDNSFKSQDGDSNNNYNFEINKGVNVYNSEYDAKLKETYNIYNTYKEKFK